MGRLGNCSGFLSLRSRVPKAKITAKRFWGKANFKGRTGKSIAGGDQWRQNNYQQYRNRTWVRSPTIISQLENRCSHRRLDAIRTVKVDSSTCGYPGFAAANNTCDLPMEICRIVADASAPMNPQQSATCFLYHREVGNQVQANCSGQLRAIVQKSHDTPIVCFPKRLEDQAGKQLRLCEYVRAERTSIICKIVSADFVCFDQNSLWRFR